MSTFDKVVWLLVALVFAPVLITPAGWMFATVVATIVVVASYGGRYLLDLEKQRRQGERGAARKIRDRGRDRGGDR